MMVNDEEKAKKCRNAEYTMKIRKMMTKKTPLRLMMRVKMAKTLPKKYILMKVMRKQKTLPLMMLKSTKMRLKLIQWIKIQKPKWSSCGLCSAWQVLDTLQESCVCLFRVLDMQGGNCMAWHKNTETIVRFVLLGRLDTILF